MKKFISLLLVLFWAVPVFAEDLPDSVFPWGACSKYISNSAERDSMRDTLGFNLIFLYWDWTRPPSHIVDFMNDDMVVYPDRGPVINQSDSTNYFIYAEAHYSMIYANDNSSQVRFYERNSLGSDPLYGFFPYEDDTSNTRVVVLDSLCYKQEYKNAFLSPSGTVYYRRLHMRIDTDGVASSDTVAILFSYNCDEYGENRIPIDSFFIIGGEFPDNDSITIDCGYYTREADGYTSFGIVSTCKTEVYFDFLKIFCADGEELIDNGSHDDKIMQSAATLFGGENVAGWHMCDEPMYDHFLSLWYVDSLIMEATSGFDDIPRAVTDWSIVVAGEYTRDFIQIAKPELIWADPYQFYGGQGHYCIGDTGWSYGRFTDYAGGDTSYGSAPGHWGLQKALRKTLSEPAEIIRSACNDAGIDWWFVAQAFSIRKLNCGSCSYDTNYYWRLPTQSELTCIIYMGLCYDARGIVFWKYHPLRDSNTICDDYYSEGFKDLDGNYTPVWYGAYEANRYMKAITDTYLGLTWNEAYYIKPDSAMPGGWIDTIYAISNSPDSNPDLGWFHVGQYTEGSDKYIMLVNRACSQGPENPAPAPSITAIVKFDPTALGLGSYVYVIDLADSLRLAGADTGWVGIPDTTYSAKMPDGAIPFTTVLGPGEGRLFKIVQSR